MKHEGTSRSDLYAILDRAADDCLEAICKLRAAQVATLPPQHRQLLAHAIERLEFCQLDLFEMRNLPWGQSPIGPLTREQLEAVLAF